MFLEHLVNVEGMKSKDVIHTFGKLGIAYRSPDGKRRYISYRKQNPHYVIRHEGYGISVSIFDHLKTLNIDEIVMVITDVGRVLIAPPSEFERLGVVDKLGNFEKQIFLRECKFDMYALAE